MATIDHETVGKRLTNSRLASYLAVSGGDVVRAIEIYDWNVKIGGAFHEDLGRLEVVFRNVVDDALLAYGAALGWPTVWYRRAQLFPGRRGRRALDDIEIARRRATTGGVVETHGKVIAELSFGFWRYICTPNYHTSLWVPSLSGAFPNHPENDDPRAVRADVADRMQRIHFLRNRVAHHEPIHHRDLQRDAANIVELVGWICSDTRDWVVRESRVSDVLARRP
jgi:hypothetical protein